MQALAEDGDLVRLGHAGQRLAGAPGIEHPDLHELGPEQCLYLRRRVHGEEAPMVHEGHAAAALRLVEVGRAHDDGDALFQHLVEDSPEIAAGHRIDSVGGLVEEDDVRLMDQRTGEAELLLHASRELVREPALEGPEAAEVEEPPHSRRALRLGHLEEISVEVQILQHGQVPVEPESLGHVGDAALDPLGLLTQRAAGHHRVAGRGPENPGQHAQGGGLACSIGPDETEELAALDGEGQAVDGGDGAKAPGEATQVDGDAHSSKTLTSAGMPGLSSWLGFSRPILTAKTSLTRSSGVWMFLGVNSASELMKITLPR